MSESSAPRTDVNSLGEFGLIDHLTKNFPLHHPSSTLRGIGDDAAVLDAGQQKMLVSTDMLMEGIHFDLAYTPLKHLGYKSVVVNLSDIYAMNATPKQITVSFAISNRFSVEALDELYDGIRAACQTYGVDLVGGDTTSSLKGLVISITAIGYQDADKIVYRSGAKVGDLVCVTGSLGGAYLGLQILEREKRLFLDDPNIKPDLEEQAFLIQRQLRPEARKEIIEEYFAKAKLIPTAMIDVSDGLSSELHHICRQSQVGAFVEEDQVPMNPEAKLMALKFAIDPLACAFSGGEDYELLFTIDPKDVEKIRSLPDIYIMGEIVEKEAGVTLHTNGGKIVPLQAQGWQHFVQTPSQE